MTEHDDRPTDPAPADTDTELGAIRHGPLERVIRDMAERQLAMSERISELALAFEEHQQSEDARLSALERHIHRQRDRNGATLR